MVDVIGSAATVVETPLEFGVYGVGLCELIFQMMMRHAASSAVPPSTNSRALAAMRN